MTIDEIETETVTGIGIVTEIVTVTETETVETVTVTATEREIVHEDGTTNMMIVSIEGLGVTMKGIGVGDAGVEEEQESLLEVQTEGA
jgi:hypothetical protein